MMTRRTILSLFAAVALTAGVARAEQFVVIVNQSNPTAKLSKKELARLFLKQSLSWEHGEKAVPVDLEGRSPTRAVFTSAVHGRPVAAVQGYWNLKVFSGAVVPPAQKASDRDVIQFVAANAGAVGYVSPSATLQGVKVLQVVE